MEDDTGLPAVGDQDDGAQPFSEAQQKVIDGMLEKQTDKLTSHFGRIVTKQFEEKFKPELKKDFDPEKINEELSERLFGGDVEGTIKEVIKKSQEEQQELSKQKQAAMDKELEKYEEKEFFKETKDDVSKLAQEAISKGYPPGPAVELAYEKASKNFLRTRDPDYKLSMSRGGTPPTRQRKVKMPEALKAAAQRDINDGLFKDEAEYLAELPSSVKEKYGI